MSKSKTILEEKQEYISSAMTNSHTAYLSRNPISARAHHNATKCMPGGNTRSSLHAQPFPLSFTGGSGNKLTSADGHTYVDFLGEYSAGLFGHSNPRIEEALKKAMKAGWNYGGESLYEKELARKITMRFSKGGMDLVRFTNSGTEANMMAIAAAIAWTGRKKVLVFSNGYHGGTLVFTMEICKWSHSKT